MFDITRKETMWGGRKLTLETGRVARQATGAVLATYGETVVLCTVVGAKTAKPGQDFFPLTVNYQEKAFAAGKIPGGFFKREGRPSEKEVLTSRLIDRPIRPLFHENYKNETLVVITTLAHDMENDPDIVSMVATSAALTISGAPFLGPIGAARVGYLDGKYVINPTLEQTKKSDLDLLERYAQMQMARYCQSGCSACEGSCPEAVPIAEVLDKGAFDLKRILEMQPDFLAGEDDHEHNEDVASMSFEVEKPIDPEKFNAWIGVLLQDRGPDLLRTKGILNYANEDRRFAFQAVHMIADGDFIGPWKEGEERKSRIVFIGRNLNRPQLRRGFEACQAR